MLQEFSKIAVQKKNERFIFLNVSIPAGLPVRVSCDSSLCFHDHFHDKPPWFERECTVALYPARHLQSRNFYNHRLLMAQWHNLFVFIGTAFKGIIVAWLGICLSKCPDASPGDSLFKFPNEFLFFYDSFV